MNSILKWTLAIGAGALVGFAYWYFVGCDGGCAITGSPYRSTIYGAVMGGLFRWSFIAK